MAKALLGQPEAKKRLGEAVRAVESRSCAEIVIAVRPRSANFGGPDSIVGAVVAYAGLLYTLYAPQEFGLLWISLIVLAGYFAGMFLSRSLPALRTRLLGLSRLDAAVRQAARATFVELGVSATRERSGVLVYVSMTERRCTLVPDVGISARVPEDAWNKAAAAVESTIPAHGVGPEGLDALCRAVEALGDVLEEPMPRREDDTNELEDVA